MVTRRSPMICLSLAVLAAPLSATAARHLGAHVHGVTTLNIALDGQLLSIEGEMPGVNIVGFEHPPHSDAERAQLASALATLRNPAEWMKPNAEARCRVTTAEVKDDGFHDGAGAGQHADFDTRYLFTCDAPLNLRTIELSLIQHFSGTHEVRVNAVLPSGQAQEVFTTPVAAISFSPNAP